MLYQVSYEAIHDRDMNTREIWTKKIDLAPNVWLHSSVGRASHRYSRRSGVRIPLKPWFFSGFFFQDTIGLWLAQVSRILLLINTQITEPISGWKLLLPFVFWWNLRTWSSMNPSVSDCAVSGEAFSCCSFFSWSCRSKMGKTTNWATAKKQTKAASGEKLTS